MEAELDEENRQGSPDHRQGDKPAPAWPFRDVWRPILQKRIGVWIWYFRQQRKPGGRLVLDRHGKTREVISRDVMSAHFGWKTSSYVYQLETGHRDPGYEILGRIAEYFNVDPSKFLTEPPEEVVAAMQGNRSNRGRRPKQKVEAAQSSAQGTV